MQYFDVVHGFDELLWLDYEPNHSAVKPIT